MPQQHVKVLLKPDRWPIAGIRFTITGKDNVTDSWLLLQCIASREGHLDAVTVTTHAAGWTWQDIVDQGMKDYAPWGITKGAIPEMPPTVFPRGRVIFKTTRELMMDVSRQCNADWWYDNNQVNMRPDGKYLSEAVVLNSNTGLIGPAADHGERRECPLSHQSKYPHGRAYSSGSGLSVSRVPVV